MGLIRQSFSFDSPLYSFGGWVYKLFVLNLLWVIFSLPIVTIGASTTAVFFVTNKWVRGEDVPIIPGFWRSFTQNFVQATVMWVALFFLGNVIAVNIQNVGYYSGIGQYLFILQLIALIELIFTSIYLFALLSRHHVPLLGGFKAAFFMVNRHLVTTLMIAIGLMGLLFATYYFGVIALFIVSLYALWVSNLLIPVFERYRNGIDGEGS